MKEIVVNSNIYGKHNILVDTEDYEKIINMGKWTIFKHRNTLYAKRRRKDNTTLLLHQFILGTDDKKEVIIDHINRNGLDNRKSNLRIVSNADNIRNSKINITNTSGFKGVSFHKPTRKWRAYITVYYKQIYLGLFENVCDAIKSRKEAEKKYFDTSNLFLEKKCLDIKNNELIRQYEEECMPFFVEKIRER